MDYHRALISLIIGLMSFHLAHSEEETLLDTRNATTDLGWPKSRGWLETSNHDENGDLLRTFQVCRIRSPNQDNWLRTPYIEVGNVERIYIEIRFSMRSCEDIKNIVSCKETFNLYYLPSEGTDDRKASHTDDKTYTKVDTIAADERFKPDKGKTNTETRIVTPLRTRGFYLAFQDTGACMTIMHVRIYYKTCAQALRGLAVFPVTVTGPELTSLVDVSGTCVANAERMQNAPAPSLHCNGEGEWLVPTGGTCQCSPGFQPNDQLTECNECAIGKFKSQAGNSLCSGCPDNSFSILSGRTSCRCSSGFFRAPEDPRHAKCTQPPSGATVVESVVNETDVTLTWNEPTDNGGRVDITYTVSCHRCDASYTMCYDCASGVDFYPRKYRLTEGKVVVKDLAPFTHYRFKIYSFNGVSSVSGKQPKFAEITIQTNQAAPSPVQSIRITSAANSAVELEWDEPSSSSPIVDYQLRYASVHGSMTNSTSARNFRLTNLQHETAYTVQIRARSKSGFGLFGRKVAFSTKSSRDPIPSVVLLQSSSSAPVANSNGHLVDNDEDLSTMSKALPDRNQLILGIVITVSLLVMMIGILLIVCSRKRKYAKTIGCDFEKYPGFINSSVDLISTRTYVDPSTYEDPYSAVQEFANEIEYRFVSIEQVIGKGEFGEVCKGVLTSSCQAVAIKTLKAGYSNQEKLDFLSEASIMGQFDHPNVIRLEGVVTKSRPLMIITEFMENRSLDDYLRVNEGKLEVCQLVGFLHNVASGMQYLSDMGYVHRDLAARNVLVNSQLVCKVSDFGLSRVLEEVGEEEVAMYTTRGGMIPIRWTAPEAITQRTFSSSSDVWSYGIMTWEVLSYGERPYWEMSNQDVVHFVECGYRLPSPCYCPRILHHLMLDCWNQDRARRPTFQHLVSQLDRFLSDVVCLNDTMNNRPFRDQDDCIPEILDLSSLGQWLEQMRLLQHKSTMLRHGCVTAEQIMRLNQRELENMGVENPEEVQLILHEAQLLRHKIEEVNQMGVAV